MYTRKITHTIRKVYSVNAVIMVQNYLRGTIQKILLFVAATILPSTTVVGQDNNEQLGTLNRDIHSYYLDLDKFSIGIERFSYLYKEPGFMKFQGTFYGLNASYSHFLNNNVLIQPEVRVAKGTTAYSSRLTGSFNEGPNILLEARILLKRNSNISELLDISPFIGFGYRYKKDGKEGIFSTTGHESYKRESNYYYIPIGLTFETAVNKEWGTFILMEYDLFIKGVQKTHMRLIKSDSPVPVIHNQDEGFGARGEVLFTKNFEKYNFSIGPFINYWNIGKSDLYRYYIPVQGGLARLNFREPKNNTMEYGMKIKFTF